MPEAGKADSAPTRERLQALGAWVFSYDTG